MEIKNVPQYINSLISGMAIDYISMSEKAADLPAAFCRGENVSDTYFPFTLIDRSSISPVFLKAKTELAERILKILSDCPYPC